MAMDSGKGALYRARTKDFRQDCWRGDSGLQCRFFVLGSLASPVMGLKLYYEAIWNGEMVAGCLPSFAACILDSTSG